MPEQSDVPIEALLRRRVIGALIVAALRTVYLSFSSWRSVRFAEQNAYWVSLTCEVTAMIQAPPEICSKTEISARAFARSGQEPSLVLYQRARDTTYQETSRLLVFVQEER
ncbi:MAG TPA: hypothetical protein VMU26_13330 [Candidatus Polarisedimenticolia bacterium]|nr:hypothetical protein [Candidatus Polarisedimenticolia bacterium]